MVSVLYFFSAASDDTGGERRCLESVFTAVHVDAATVIYMMSSVLRQPAVAIKPSRSPFCDGPNVIHMQLVSKLTKL